MASFSRRSRAASLAALLVGCRDTEPCTCPPADTAGPPADTADLQDADADGVAVGENDCDDEDADVHPGAADPTGDGRDTDCDGTDGAALDVLDHARFVVTGGRAHDDLGTSVACASSSVGRLPSAVAVGATQHVPWPDFRGMAPGFALVFDGRASGGLTRSDAVFQLLGSADTDHLGDRVVFPGDTDGDGRGELLVTAARAYRPKNGSGAAWLSPIDGQRVRTVDEAPVWVVGTWGRNLGGAAPLGDVDGDGRSDLLLSELGGDGVSIGGAVRVFAASTLDEEVGQEEALVTVVGLDPWSDTGAAMAVGDLTGDGHPDLVSAESSAGTGGRVLIAPGPVASWSFSAGLSVVAVSDTRSFGRDTALGDVNGDGQLDLLVTGWVDEGLSGQGEVRVFFGPVDRDLSSVDADVFFRTEQLGFGASVTSGDVDGDGFGDLVVGANDSYIQSDRTGLLYVFRGPLRPGVLEGPSAWRRWRSPGRQEAFGEALAACDLDHDGDDEIVVGAPGDVDGVQNRGRVFVVDGGP